MEAIAMVTIQKNQDEINLTNKDKAFVNDKEITWIPCHIIQRLTYVPLNLLLKPNATLWAPRLGDEYKCYYDTKMPISPADTIIEFS